MTVKVKTKNKIQQDQRLTLDAIHLKQLKKFQALHKSIPQKKKEICKLEEQIKKHPLPSTINGQLLNVNENKNNYK